ncbi:PREDICTED: uncharacterized protein LOC108375696, partial [Rhagoletis zephyria]|uniref:uncharacterized protein LOC108375696 n=1 Tax=Rhagoletis zephyria TaxID=28612 RepID=UPI0008118F8C
MESEKGQQQNDRDCSMCHNPPDDKMASCMKCHKLFHRSCANVADNIAYKCPQCSDNRPASPAPSATSRCSNRSRTSQSRSVQLQLKKLQEQRELDSARDREFLNKKYQLLEEAEDLCSNSSQNSQSVRDWLADTQQDISRQHATNNVENQAYVETSYLPNQTTCVDLPTRPANQNSYSSNIPCISTAHMRQQQNSQGITSVTNAAVSSTIINSAPISASAVTTNREYDRTLPFIPTNAHPPAAVPFSYLPVYSNPSMQPPPVNSNTTQNSNCSNQNIPFIQNVPMSSTMHVNTNNFTSPQFNSTQHILQQSHMTTRQSVPKDLPTFSGQPEEWPIFSSTYDWSTTACNFTDTENLIRLQKALKGKALQSVQHMLIHPANVPGVIEVLRMLYGQPEKILNSIKNRISLAPKVNENNLETLTSFAIDVRSLISTITAGNLPDELNNSFLLQQLVQKLPPSYQMQWATIKMNLNNQNKKPNLSDFDNWIFSLGITASNITVDHPCTKITQAYNKDNITDNKRNNSNNNNNNSSKATASRRAYVYSHSDERKCVVCNNNNNNNCKAVSDCPVYQSLDRSEKWNVVRKNKPCKYCLCLHSGECRRKKRCGEEECDYFHHPSLHRYDGTHKQTSTTKKTNVNNTHAVEEVEVINNAHSASSQNILFKIIPITIYGNDKEIKTLAFIDEGSSISLMDESIADQLGISGVPNPLCLRWTGGGNKQRLEMNVCTVESLNLPTQTLDYELLSQRYRHLRKLPIESYTNAKPKLLIGLNHFKMGISTKTFEGAPHEPVAVCTKLGWLIYGTVAEHNSRKQFNFHICDCSESDQQLDELVRSFYTLDSVGICAKDPMLAESEKRALNLLDSFTHYKDNGHYEVPLLWKFDSFKLPD